VLPRLAAAARRVAADVAAWGGIAVAAVAAAVAAASVAEHCRSGWGRRGLWWRGP